MAPVVTIGPDVKDKRKGKKLGWQELRLCMAHEFESRTVLLWGHFSGGIEEAGRRLFDCAAAAAAWLDEQKVRLKNNQATTVLESLLPHLEPPSTTEENAPVRKAYRYLRNRLDQVDYQGATEKGLPIGSGEIESAHRYVVQARLKRPGAWWAPDNIDYMLALRLCRINQQWENYWQAINKKGCLMERC